MGLEGFKDELDLLTGRHTMRKRPTHGRLYAAARVPRLPHGPDLLEEIGIEGTRMRLPPTPPRTYNSAGQQSSRGVSSAEDSRDSSESSAESVLELREDSAKKKEENGLPVQRKSYSSPLYSRISQATRSGAPITANSSPQPRSPDEPLTLRSAHEQIDLPRATWEDEFWPLEGESFELAQASDHHEDRLQLAHLETDTSRVREAAKLVPAEPSSWTKAADDSEGILAKPEAEEVLHGLPEWEPLVEETEDTAEKPRATSSPRPLGRVRQAQQTATKPKQRVRKEDLPVVDKAPKPGKAKPERVLLAPKPPKQHKSTPHRQPQVPKPKLEPKDKKREPLAKNVPLPISTPESTPEPEGEPTTPASAGHAAADQRAPMRKKERLQAPSLRRPAPAPAAEPPSPPCGHRERGGLVYSDDEDDTQREEEERERESGQTVDLPSLPNVKLAGPHPTPGGRQVGPKGTIGDQLSGVKSKPRWGQKLRDTSLLDEEERERIAEERRRKIAAIFDHHKGHKGGDGDGSDDGSSGFDDYGFLEKYCILTASTTEKYRYTFQHVDDGNKGYLTEEETAYGLRAVNPSLSTSERTYLFRVLEMAGHRLKKGTSLRLFSILAALSQRVARLDEWARNMMGEFNYQNLERKLFLCKTLWECNVDETSRQMSLDQMIVELRAGGISPQHEDEVRRKLGALRSLDFFDFLLYVPLFVTIHETVLTDPLSVSRQA